MYQFKKQWLAFEFFPIEKIAFNCQLFKVFIRNWFYRTANLFPLRSSMIVINQIYQNLYKKSKDFGKKMLLNEKWLYVSYLKNGLLMNDGHIQKTDQRL